MLVSRNENVLICGEELWLQRFWMWQNCVGIPRLRSPGAFASPEQVSEKARNKIYQAAQQLNYTPDAIARAMVRGRTDNIGFIIYENSIPL